MIPIAQIHEGLGYIFIKDGNVLCRNIDDWLYIIVMILVFGLGGMFGWVLSRINFRERK